MVQRGSATLIPAEEAAAIEEQKAGRRDWIRAARAGRAPRTRRAPRTSRSAAAATHHHASLARATGGVLARRGASATPPGRAGPSDGAVVADVQPLFGAGQK